MASPEQAASTTLGERKLPAGWVPRFYEPGDEAGAIDVLLSAFGTWPKIDIAVAPIEHLLWKISSPFGGAAYTIVAEVDGRIVGWQAYRAQQILVEGQLLRTRIGMDSCVHPDYQRSNIKTEMRHLTMDNPRRDHQVTLGLTSGHPAMRRIQERWGRRARRYLANSIEALTWRKGNHLDTVSTLLARLRARGSGSGGVPVRPASHFDERVDTLWEAASQQFDIIVERRQAFLNWRYADPRAGAFHIALAEEGSQLLGYIVMSRHRQRGLIADLLVMPGRPDVVDALVAHAVDVLEDGGVEEIECWSPHRHPYRAVLRARGFVHKRRTVPLVCRISIGRTERMTCGNDPRAAVHLTMGDTDIV
jgi:hypothetical protein